MRQRSVVLSVDVDWAPDFMVEPLRRLLVESNVRSTWFVTHDSPGLERLREHPHLFELGIHPNFLPGSTHGSTQPDVFKHCLGIVPEAITMRTHCLVQSTPLLQYAREATPLRIDASLYVPRSAISSPFEQWSPVGAMLRIPHVWEDDLEMMRPDATWSIEPVVAATAGVVVLDFHPVHVFLNSSSFTPYARLKASGVPLTELSEDDVVDSIRSGRGAGTMFAETVAYLSRYGGGDRLCDVAEAWAGAG